MNMPIRARHDVAMDRWNRFLDDLDACAGTKLPLENQGKLVRVAGLVLEAAGLRLLKQESFLTFHYLLALGK